MRKRFLTLLVVSVGVLLIASGIVWVSGRQFNNTPQKNNYNIEKLSTQNSDEDHYGESAPSNYTWPAEFEKQEAIWMQWPSEIYNQKSTPINPALINIIKALDPYIQINIAARSTDEIAQIRILLQNNGYSGTNAHFYVFDHLSIWARDVGPVFVKDNQGKLNVVDFGFNNYSRDASQQYIDVESQEHRLIAGYFGFPLVKTNLISEGGAIESNGNGTMMATEAVALKRNPNMTRQQIEDEYKRVLGVKKVIWLKNGLAEDDRITTGHINEYCRFVSPTTILLAEVLPGDRYACNFSQETYRRMEENYNVLKNSTDEDGKPFKIIRVPMPSTLYTETDSSGTLPVRSYLNFMITNGAVLMQTYWIPGKSNELKDTEEGVREILQSVFPGRKIIGLDAESVNEWGGGIHCITQHMPAE
jgi:agmatine deiminase